MKRNNSQMDSKVEDNKENLGEDAEEDIKSDYGIIESSTDDQKSNTKTTPKGKYL